MELWLGVEGEEAVEMWSDLGTVAHDQSGMRQRAAVAAAQAAVTRRAGAEATWTTPPPKATPDSKRHTLDERRRPSSGRHTPDLGSGSIDQEARQYVESAALAVPQPTSLASWG